MRSESNYLHAAAFLTWVYAKHYADHVGGHVVQHPTEPKRYAVAIGWTDGEGYRYVTVNDIEGEVDDAHSS